MITNGRIQLWPFLRVALFLVVGVLFGDALDCRVPSCVWMWAYVALLSAFVASYFFCANIPSFRLLCFLLWWWQEACGVPLVFLRIIMSLSPMLQNLMRL